MTARPPLATVSLAPAHAQPGAALVLETGIKAIDLLTPLRRGGALGLFGSYGVGKLMLIGELVQMVAARHRGCAVLVAPEARQEGVNELVGMLRTLGIEQATAMIVGPLDGAPGAAERLLAAGFTVATSLREQGYGDVLFLADAQLAIPERVAWIASQSLTEAGAISSIFYGEWHGLVNPDLSPLLAYLDALLIMDLERANRGLFPAINFLASDSRLLTAEIIGEAHAETAAGVRALLQRYATLRKAAAAGEVAHLTDEDRQTIIRAQRIQSFMTQPLSVAEPFTGIPGEYVPRHETVAGFQRLLNGELDGLPDEALRYVGNFAQALEKAESL